MTEELKTYPIVVEIPVAWADMDAMGHVNNTKYLTYYETGRIFYFGRLMLGKLLEESNIGPILSSQTIYYKAPVTFPDKVTVYVKITDLVEDSFIMRFIITSQALKRVAAEGEGKFVFYNYKEKKRMNIPEKLLRRIKRIERRRN
jgi:acyl-CoA thioester hydrolase